MLLTEQEKIRYEQEGRKPHFRFKLDRNKTVKWNDEVKGEINIATIHISDPVVKEKMEFIRTCYLLLLMTLTLM